MPTPIEFIDAMLTPEEAAKWMQMSKVELLSKSKGRRPVVPNIRLSERMIRYVPRVIIAKLSVEGGVSMEVIAASFQHAK